MKKLIVFFFVVFFSISGFSYYNSYCYYRVEYVPFVIQIYYFSYNWGVVDFNWLLEYRPVLVKYCERYWIPNYYSNYYNENYYKIYRNYHRYYKKTRVYKKNKILFKKRIIKRRSYKSFHQQKYSRKIKKIRRRY